MVFLIVESRPLPVAGDKPRVLKGSQCGVGEGLQDLKCCGPGRRHRALEQVPAISNGTMLSGFFTKMYTAQIHWEEYMGKISVSSRSITMFEG